MALSWARAAVPYADGRIRGFLPAYRFKPPRARCTIVFFGGFDSYIEELTSAFVDLRDAGYDVIAFDGPGQGDALNDSGLPITAEWHKPVGAVLDYVVVERAVLLTLRGARIVNWMLARVARRSPVVQWGLQEGMHVTGTTSVCGFLQAISQFETAAVSALIRQDALLLAGREDRYVPMEQWHDQIRTLKNARSITARLLTRGESAQNHCQVGNYGLALTTIVQWLDGLLLDNAQPFSRRGRNCDENKRH
jgi:pimeloyl-ACP methyl ester carboxylesterase